MILLIFKFNLIFLNFSIFILSFWVLLAGDRFISKQADKNKKKKHNKVEQKMLGWGTCQVIS